MSISIFDECSPLTLDARNLQHLATEYVSFRTGSRVFGGATDVSDWDVCVLAGDGVYSRLIESGFRHSPDEGSNEHQDESCANLFKGKVNVILLPEPLFTGWRVATDAMKHVGGNLADRDVRIQKFQYIRDGYLNAVHYDPFDLQCVGDSK